MEQNLFEDIRLFVRGAVSEKRYEHSMRTAELLARLCRIYSVDESSGWISGIAHDMCKEIDGAKMLCLAEKDGKKITALEREKLSLLHGRAAAVLIREQFGVTDNDIREAIANHVFGAPGLCPLAKLLFVADKTEPGRPQSTDEYRARLFSLPLEELALAVVTENIMYHEQKGKKVADASYLFRDSLLAAVGRGENA